MAAFKIPSAYSLPGINRQGYARYERDRANLANMTMQGKQWLHGFDKFTHSMGAGGFHHHLPSVTILRSSSSSGQVSRSYLRRHMDRTNSPFGILDEGSQGLHLLLKLIFFHVTRKPRGSY